MPRPTTAIVISTILPDDRGGRGRHAEDHEPGDQQLHGDDHHDDQRDHGEDPDDHARHDQPDVANR